MESSLSHPRTAVPVAARSDEVADLPQNRRIGRTAAPNCIELPALTTGREIEGRIGAKPPLQVRFSAFLFLRWASQTGRFEQRVSLPFPSAAFVLSLTHRRGATGDDAPDGREAVLRACAGGFCVRRPGEIVSLVAPASVLGAFVAGPSRFGALSGVRGAFLANHLDLLGRLLPAAGDADHAELAMATHKLLAFVFNESSMPQAPGQAGAGRELRRRVEQIIHDELSSARLDVKRICALADVSRSTLYRLYEGTGGVFAYIKSLRLKLVCADLLDPDLVGVPINRIAARRGFHCETSFNRTFRRAYGRTPGEMRRGAIAPQDPR
jgi:AraC-like DNA-binding protein